MLWRAIKENSLFPAIDHYFDEIFGSIEIGPWIFIAAILIFSNGALEILRSIRKFCDGQRLPVVGAVVECGYLVAIVLLAGTRRAHLQLPPRLHYNVYYALYLFENHGTRSFSDLVKEDSVEICKRTHLAIKRLRFAKSRQPRTQSSLLQFFNSSTSKEPTFEQYRIINYDLQRNDIVKIIAFAGTGKTTTLKKYCEYRPRKRILVIVFNKDVQVRSAKEFPPNATVKTMHSIAYNGVNVRRLYQRKLRSKLKIHDIQDVIEAGLPGMSYYTRCKFILEAVMNFIASEDWNLTWRHLPDFVFDDQSGEKYQLNSQQRNSIANDAERVWNLMIDSYDQRIPMLHDGYLKLFHLKKLEIGSEYDYILVDEAQDCNPATLAIVMAQPQPKIFVGDPHQQIYSFRGAVNALDIVTANKTFYLTQSFRFGPEIGFVAQCCLEKLKDVKDKIIVGSEKFSSLDGQKTDKVTIIARNNETVFHECAKIARISGSKLYIGGGKQNFGFQDLKDLFIMMCTPALIQDRVKNPFYLRFSEFAKLYEFAQRTRDVEIVWKCRVVQQLSLNLPTVIEQIDQCCVGKPEDANWIVTTAHKAKGLEFDTVRIASDFPTDDPVLLHTGLTFDAEGFDIFHVVGNILAGDEKNLLYVAVTRAKRCLILNESLIKLLQRRCRETFEIPIPFREAKMKMAAPVSVSGVQLTCLKCSKQFALADCEFVWYRKPMAMTWRIGRVGQLGRGVFCRECSTGKEPLVYQFNSEIPDDPNAVADVAYLWTSYGIDYVGNPTSENDKPRMSVLSLLDPQWKDKRQRQKAPKEKLNVSID